ncbi:MAG: type II secretion system minor pseudopilin GspI [Steroidobacteraceae bacterium]
MRRARGFTLIEVLVALVIVAVGMAALLGTLTSAADSSIYLRDKTFAEWIALNRISELRLAAKRPSKGKATGELDYAGRKWRYEQEVVETDVQGVLRIDVRVADAATRPGAKGTSKNDWTVTASGVVGDAVAPPNGADPDWNGGPFPGEPTGSGGEATPPGATPAPTPTPTPPGSTLPTT